MKNSQFITLIATMVVLTILWVCANDYLNKQFVYKQYGSKANYEKFVLWNSFQYSDEYSWTKEELEEQINAFREQIKASQDYEEPVQQNTVSDTTLDQSDLTTIYIPVSWNKDAKYSIYEFTDYQCPHCISLHQSGVLEQAITEIENVNLVRRNFQFHEEAPMRATASFCAMEQKWDEAYVKMLDLIYEGNLSKNEILEEGQTTLWLDKTALEECINSWKYETALNSDYNLARKMWVSWTPSIFVVNNETWAYTDVLSRSVEWVRQAIASLE